MTNEKMLAVRKAIKSRKPTFRRRQAHQFPKLRNDPKWRAPKGMGNKVRRGRKGQPLKPTVGYRSPKLVRGLNKLGLKEILVYNVSDLKLINVKTQIAVLGGTVGGRKKLEILSEAKNSKISFANIKDIDKAIESLTKKKKDSKESKKTEKKSDKKENKKKESEKKESKKDTSKSDNKKEEKKTTASKKESVKEDK